MINNQYPQTLTFFVKKDRSSTKQELNNYDDQATLSLFLLIS
jgi:hypothetical protein